MINYYHIININSWAWKLMCPEIFRTKGPRLFMRSILTEWVIWLTPKSQADWSLTNSSVLKKGAAKKHVENNLIITRRLWKPKFEPKKRISDVKKLDVLSFIIFRKFQLQIWFNKKLILIIRMCLWNDWPALVPVTPVGAGRLCGGFYFLRLYTSGISKSTRWLAWKGI